MSGIASGVWTLEEIDAQIANIKAQLLAPNAGYSVSPNDGGASRSVQRESREALNRELNRWMKRRASFTGATTGGMRIQRAVVKSRCCR